MNHPWASLPVDSVRLFFKSRQGWLSRHFKAYFKAYKEMDDEKSREVSAGPD
jgi:hypothetical protein